MKYIPVLAATFLLSACGGSGSSDSEKNNNTGAPIVEPSVGPTPEAQPIPEVQPTPTPSVVPSQEPTDKQQIIQALSGTWKRDCMLNPGKGPNGETIYIVSYHSYTTSELQVHHLIYNDSLCTNLLIEPKIDMVNKFGDIVYTTNSIPALEFDGTCVDKSITSGCRDDYNILYIDGENYYPGIGDVGDSPATRPKTLDLNNPFVKQPEF